MASMDNNHSPTAVPGKGMGQDLRTDFYKHSGSLWDFPHLFKHRGPHTIPSSQPRFFCCVHPTGIPVKKKDTWAKLKEIGVSEAGFRSKLRILYESKAEACSVAGVYSPCSRKGGITHDHVVITKPGQK